MVGAGEGGVLLLEMRGFYFPGTYFFFSDLIYAAMRWPFNFGQKE